MEDNPTLSKISNGIKNSVSFKILTVLALTLILLIPTTMIKSLVREREARKGTVIDDITSKWGEAQTITGPVMTVPYKEWQVDRNGRKVDVVKYMHFLPDDLDYDCRIFPETRYRGIYEAVLFRTRIEITGRFSRPDIRDMNVSPDDVLWSSAYLSVGISDLRGIRDQVKASFNADELIMDPGVETDQVIARGIGSKIDLSQQAETYLFKLGINLNGSHKLSLIPVGKTTIASMTSTWASPCFDGAYLPVSREISKDGFSAKWKILHLNRSYPQQWKGEKYKIDPSNFGIRMFIPVDTYQKSIRTAKYAIMFIVFAFGAFFFSEIMSKIRLHPIQYILVGFSVTIFYALLISISEHTNFGVAYLISGISVIALISGYAKSVLKSLRLAGIVSGILVILYTYLYILLQLEDYALLMGSIGLFAVLGTVMYLTRKLDWYAIKIENKAEEL